MVRKGDSHPSDQGSILRSGGWGLGTYAYKHICIQIDCMICECEWKLLVAGLHLGMVTLYIINKTFQQFHISLQECSSKMMRSKTFAWSKQWFTCMHLPLQLSRHPAPSDSITPKSTGEIDHSVHFTLQVGIRSFMSLSTNSVWCLVIL